MTDARATTRRTQVTFGLAILVVRCGRHEIAECGVGVVQSHHGFHILRRDRRAWLPTGSSFTRAEVLWCMLQGLVRGVESMATFCPASCPSWLGNGSYRSGLPPGPIGLCVRS